MSKIEWTGETWNPLVGCTIHSAGCKGCYAMKEAWRFMHHPHPAIAAKFAGTAKMVNGHAVWTGRINFSEAALLAPLKRKRPTTYFVNSMSDLFHQGVTDAQIDRIFAVMALCPQHTFQVLTKRADRMRGYFAQRLSLIERHASALRSISSDFGALTLGDAMEALSRRPHLHNVLLGVSVEDQRTADERIPDLLATSAAVRFLSCEPLIGAVDLRNIRLRRDGQHPTPLSQKLGDYVLPLRGAFTDSPKLDWIIVGGESGPKARPMHPDWARSLRDQCAAAGVPFFFKQWGEYRPYASETDDYTKNDPTGEYGENGACHVLNDGEEPGPANIVIRVGKKAAGRLLDGVTHDGMPS